MNGDFKTALTTSASRPTRPDGERLIDDSAADRSPTMTNVEVFTVDTRRPCCSPGLPFTARRVTEKTIIAMITDEATGNQLKPYHALARIGRTIGHNGASRIW